jgi:hypothetical protein
VEAFLLLLDAHPVGESGQPQFLEVRGHGQIQVTGIVFPFDLIV